MIEGLTLRTDDSDWGSGKGTNLTANEVDQNFWNLVQRIIALETNTPEPAEIASIDVTGSRFTITLDNATVFGPYELPVAAFQWRGTWAPETLYDVFDLVTIDEGDNAGVYMVLVQHESDEAFNPNAENTEEGSFYQLVFGASGGGGGGGGAFRVANVFTEDYMLGVEDANSYLRVKQITYIQVPDHSTAAIPIGTEILIEQDYPTGDTDDSGVIISSENEAEVLVATGRVAETRAEHSVLRLIKLAEDRWIVTGDLKVDE